MTRTSTPSKHKIEPGRNLGGQYELIQEIGKGAFGKVFLARDLVLARNVAVKVLRRELAANPETIALFQREARLLSCFNHPNVVSIYTFGFEPPGLHYIVLEYIEGDSLETLIKGGKSLSPSMFCEVMAQVGQALSEAHRHGIMHLDLKPLNVLLSRASPHPIVKIIDFGLAKVFDRALVHPDKKVWDSNANNKGFGSPPYMAPEQHKAHSEYSDQWRPTHLRDPNKVPASGEPVPVDARADIYALGVMASELLCGYLPYDASSEMGFWFAKLNGSPRLPNLTPDIDAVLSRALAINPEDRYQNAAEFIEAIIRAVRLWHPEGHTHTTQDLSHLSPPITQPPNPLLIALRDRNPQQNPRNAHTTANVALVYLRIKIVYRPQENTVIKRPTEENFDLYADHLRILANRIQQAAALFRGTPLAPLSDNQVFLFGLSPGPDNTDEDAIDAALAIRSALMSLRQDPTVQVPFNIIFSLGIDAGPMLLTNDEFGRCISHGRPLIIAHALTEYCRSDEVRISHTFHRRVRADMGYFVSAPEPGVSTRDAGFIVQHKRHRRASQLTQDLCGLYIQCFGRDQEIQTLTTHVRALFRQPIGVLLQVGGGACVGKSRVLAEFDRQVEAWEEIIFVDTARCLRQDAHPCAPFIQTLRARLHIEEHDTSASIDYKLNQFFCHWICKDPSKFDPEETSLLDFVRGLLDANTAHQSSAHQSNTSSGSPPSSNPAQPADPHEPLPAASHVSTELRWLTMFYRRLLEFHPLLIVIEDYHRAPPLTRTLVENLWLQLVNEPVALLLIGQTKPKQPLVSPQLRTHTRVSPLIELSPLPGPVMQKLVAHMLRRIQNPPDWLTSQLLNLSSGLPIIAEEILRDLADDGEIIIRDDRWTLRTNDPLRLEIPRSLERLLLNNLEQLTPAQRAILEVTAAAKKRAWPSLLAAVVDPVVNVKQELLFLEQQGILYTLTDIHPRNESFYSFVHAASRNALYSRISPERRQSLYQAIASTIERDPSRALLADDLTLGRYHARAAQPARALHYLLNAAQRLSHTPPLQQTLDILSECQTIIEKASLLQDTQDVATYNAATEACDLLCELLRLQGAWLRALELLERTERAAAVHSSVSPLRAKLNIHIADLLRVLGRTAEAFAALDLAARILEPLAHQNPLLALMLATSHAVFFLEKAQREPSHAVFQALREQLESPAVNAQKTQEGRRMRARAYRVLGDVCFHGGLAAEAQQLYRRSQQIAIAAQATPDLMDTLLAQGDLAWASQDYVQAQQLWQDVQITATEHDLLHAVAESQLRLALTCLSEDPPKALDLAQSAQTFFAQSKAHEPLSRTLPLLGHCALSAGNAPLAWQCAQDILNNATLLNAPFPLTAGLPFIHALCNVPALSPDRSQLHAYLGRYRDALLTHQLHALAQTLPIVPSARPVTISTTDWYANAKTKETHAPQPPHPSQTLRDFRSEDIEILRESHKNPPSPPKPPPRKDPPLERPDFRRPTPQAPFKKPKP